MEYMHVIKKCIKTNKQTNKNYETLYLTAFFSPTHDFNES